MISLRTLFIAALIVFFFVLQTLEAPAQGIYVDFGRRDVTHYMRPVGNTPGSDGELISAYLAPEYCAKNRGAAIYFAIDDEYLYERPTGSYNIINVEYFDATTREIKLVYDAKNSADKIHSTTIQTTGSNTWKSTSFLLSDAWFGNRQKHGADFRLECADTMSINLVRVAPFDYYLNFGATNDEYFITQKEVMGGDSQTEIVVQDGEECITGTLADQYLYCDVDDEEIWQGDFPEFFISVEYYDSDAQLTMRLQYDATDAPYKDTAWTQGKGWGSFKTYTWEVSDGYMGGRENGAADFRFHLQQPGMLINRIMLGFLDYGPSAVQDKQVEATDFRLAQNYPNPFNPATTIQYTVARTGSINLSIYNVQGELIRTLFDGQQAAGAHSQTWDGRDNNGQPTASGLYLFSLTAGDFVASRKMIKLK